MPALRHASRRRLPDISTLLKSTIIGKRSPSLRIEFSRVERLPLFSLNCRFIVMLFIAKKQKIYPGFLEWTLGTFLNSLGMVLMALRDVIPVFLSIIIANNLILLYYVFTARGLRKLQEVLRSPGSILYLQ